MVKNTLYLITKPSTDGSLRVGDIFMVDDSWVLHCRRIDTPSPGDINHSVKAFDSLKGAEFVTVSDILHYGRR